MDRHLANLDKNYRILRRLGTGGMGEVFLAEHLVLRRLEALKVLHARADSDPQQAARFRREARALNRVNHPNIVTVYNFGLINGRLCLAMEYAEGENLYRFLRSNRPLRFRRAIDILAKIAAAVSVAHEHEIIHRDLKPSNVVLVPGPTGTTEPKVIDFGLSKIVSVDYDDSVAGTGAFIIGTPHYLAPEAIRKLPGDHRIDIYALGCMAFEILTGSPPFEGPDLEVCLAHVNRVPPRLREVIGDRAPPPLDDLIAACLEKDPERRPQSAKIVATIFKQVRAAMQRHASPKPESLDTKATLRFARRRANAGEKQASEAQARSPVPRSRPSLPSGTLTALAAALLERGIGDHRLLAAYAAVGDSSGDVSYRAFLVQDASRRRGALEQSRGDRELLLRFGIDELEVLARQPGQPPVVQRAIERAAADLQARLSDVLRALALELASLESMREGANRALAEAHERYHREQAELYARVSELAPAFEGIEEVAALWRELQGGRPGSEGHG